jgi:hypothetical protein
MGTLVIVIVNPMIAPLAGVGEGGEDGLTQELPPQRLPETLDLTQSLGMMWGAANVSDALLLEYPLEPRLAPPGHELAPVVRENLPRGSPLADGSFQDLEHGFGVLLPKQSPADQVAGVIVDDPDHVDGVHPLELEGKDVDLPERVR